MNAEPLTFTLRIANAADVTHLARLNSGFNGSNEAEDAYLARLSDPQRVDTPILALLDDQAIGLANLRLVRQVLYPEPYAELTELFVEEGYRRKGVGTGLLNYAEQIARQSGATEIIILTDFYNHGAQELYRSRGFVHHDIALSKSLT